MLAAIAKRQPTLLPFATWIYQQPSRLIIPRAPVGSTPIMSERGVCQVDPCQMLYFSLTTQDQLESILLTHPEVAPVTYRSKLDCWPCHITPAERRPSFDSLMLSHVTQYTSWAIKLTQQQMSCSRKFLRPTATLYPARTLTPSQRRYSNLFKDNNGAH